MKKLNFHLAFQWLVFMPVILPLCVIFGALQGIANALESIVQQVWNDVQSIETAVEPTDY